MPAVIKADIARDAVLTQEEIRQMILNAYIADMAKYAQEKETVKIFAAYDSLPGHLRGKLCGMRASGQRI